MTRPPSDARPSGEPVRILVVDDEESILDAVATALGYEGFDVTTATGGRPALAAIERVRPALAVLDVMLPDLDGLEVCRRLRTAGNDLPVLLLTAKGAVADKVEGLRLGADDYLTKPFSLAELVARVHAMLRRARVTTASERGEELRFADLRLDPVRFEVHRGETPIRLTATEFRLLHYFLQNPRIVLSKSQILDRVWHHDLDGDPNVVETYVRYLRRKLDAHGPPLIETIRLVGYVLREPG